MKREIINLTDEVKKHDYLYDKGKPVITDTEYDRLYNKLIKLEKKYPDLALEDSPTKKIYSVLLYELSKVHHTESLLSLEKVTDEEGLQKFLERFEEEDVITVGHKEDGLTVKLEYRAGVLYQASTRGDGNVGEDITHSMRLLDSVPNYIDYEGTLIVRVEAIIDFDEFERVNGDGKYKSPRNLVSGSVRTLDAGIAEDRGVKILVFDIINWDDVGHNDWLQSKELLKDLGFTLTHSKSFNNNEQGKKDIINYCTNFEYKEREEVNHMVDGLVLKVDNYDKRKDLGTTSKYPKWAIAYKFNSLDATTTLKGVEWSVGKTGQVTPNAILEPVEIDGVVIGKASLANYANIKNRDIKVGDVVVVARANDVIPQIVSSVKENRVGKEREINLIETCPSCNSYLEHEKGKDGKGNEAITLYCKN